MQNNPNSLYNKAKSSLKTLVVQYVLVFLHFIVLFIITQSYTVNQSVLIALLFCFTVGFTAWIENKKIVSEFNNNLSAEEIESFLSLIKDNKEAWNNWKVKNTDLVLNLRSVNLEETDLRNRNLSYLDLSEANLKRADLRGVNLSCVNLSKADLRGANLGNANLSRANLKHANLNGADLSYSNLDKANLYKATFKKAILNKAILTQSFILGANLTEASINRANLNKAELSGAFFLKTFISFQIIVSLFLALFSFWRYNSYVLFFDSLGFFIQPHYFLFSGFLGALILIARPSKITQTIINIVGIAYLLLELPIFIYDTDNWLYLVKFYIQTILEIIVSKSATTHNIPAIMMIVIILIELNLRDFKFFRANISKATLSGTTLSWTNIIGANVYKTRFSNNLGLSNRDKKDLRSRGAIIDDKPNNKNEDGSLVSSPSKG